MNLYKKIQALGLDENTKVQLSYEDGCGVHHYTDSYIEEALGETGIAHTLAEVITDGPLYTVGNGILDEMRDEGLLDEYERGDWNFTDFVADVIAENHWDYDWFEHSTERYDHKRGHTTFSLEFEVRASDLKDHPHVFSGWTAQVETKHGLLTVKD